MDVANTRSAERYLLAEPLAGSYGATSVTILNISTNGAMVEHDQPLRLGTKARFAFRRQSLVVEVQAQVMWSRLSHRDGVGFYRSGVRVESNAERYAELVRNLIDAGVAIRDDDSMLRKRQKVLEKIGERTQRERTAQSRANPPADIAPDQVLLIQHTFDRLAGDQEELNRWHSRARFAIKQGKGPATDPQTLERAEVMAIWEYLERSIDPATIVRVIDSMPKRRSDQSR